MSNTSPPIEAQRFGRSQTPESPRPVHIPEPSNIPVLLNQMDPIFNDTNTYNIPSNQTFSPYGDSLESAGFHNSSVEEQDAVQSFFREAENQAAAEPIVKHPQSESHPAPDVPNGTQQYSSMSMMNENAVSQNENATMSLQHEHEPNEATTESPITAKIQQHDNVNTLSVTTTGQGSDDVPRQLQQSEVQNQQSDYGQSTSNNHAERIDYQSLLDNLTQSTSVAHTSTALTAPIPVSASVEQSSHSLPLFPGLPPKPPPQEHPVEFSNFSNDAQSQTYRSLPPVGVYDHKHQNGQFDHVPATNPSSATFANLPNDLSMKPFASSNEAPGTTTRSVNEPQPLQMVQTANAYAERPRSQDGGDRPWTPRTQSLYDQFLEDERGYVTEGVWDRFPNGSRLFVGNLPSEKVTKRDLFHTFHKHGRLAQISIKQAYGFVQYHEESACQSALNIEQGVEIRGRKVHLEVSKPQKNTRNAGGNNVHKGQGRRRSRSPDRGVRRGDRSSTSEFRDDASRRRDEYRSRRSPSPRRHGSRDTYRSGEGNYDYRRSPMYGAQYGVPPPPTAFDDEASLPIPRRDPRSVPDVQLIILEAGLAQNFINWVEQGFRNKGLQASTIWLNQRLPLASVVKRQIIEGVQAVVKLGMSTPSTGKIPLQVFDRTAGASNVNFNEYADLDVGIAADIVIRARQKERAPMPASRPPPPHAQGFPPSPYGPPVPPGSYPPAIPSHYPAQAPHPAQQSFQYPTQSQSNYRPPQHGPPTPSGQPPNLQELLANLKGNSNNPPTPQSAHSAPGRPPTDLAGLLSGVARQQSQSQQQPQYGQPQSYQSYGSAAGNQNGFAAGVQGSPTQSTGPQTNMQNIMDQLARFQR